MLCYSAWVAWSPAQTGYLAPGSKDSKEHVQYQLLGRWKELQTHVFLLANCTNLDSNSMTLLAKDDAGHFNIKKRRYWHCRTQILDVWDMLVWGALLKKHECYIILASPRHWMQCLAGTCYLKHLKTSVWNLKFWARTRKWRSASGWICLVNTVKTHIVNCDGYWEEREAGLPLRN